jgi:phosphatidate phosphatase APP1
MARWREIVAQIAGDVETQFDALKQRLDRRIGDEPLQIVAYRGYGTATQLVLSGRVLEQTGARAAADHDSVWDNLLNTYRRFATDEIAGARVLIEYGGARQEVVTDEEGFFMARLELAAPLLNEPIWREVTLTLLEPLRTNAVSMSAIGQALVPPPGAQFGIISDIDDTVLQSSATDLLKMARLVFLGNARTRLSFPGVAALYRALYEGATGPFINPIFYVSSSPWNLYDVLTDFFALQDIPAGPMMLRDWGLSNRELLPTDHHSHKMTSIRQILDFFPNLPFLLIGDSGQEDPEIYRDVVHLYPQRILAMYIRDVSRNPERDAAINALAEEVAAAGSTLILAADTPAAAQHAAAQGWITAEALAAVAADKTTDQAAPTALEMLLEEESGAGSD